MIYYPLVSDCIIIGNRTTHLHHNPSHRLLPGVDPGLRLRGSALGRIRGRRGRRALASPTRVVDPGLRGLRARFGGVRFVTSRRRRSRLGGRRGFLVTFLLAAAVASHRVRGEGASQQHDRGEGASCRSVGGPARLLCLFRAATLCGRRLGRSRCFGGGRSRFRCGRRGGLAKLAVLQRLGFGA